MDLDGLESLLIPKKITKTGKLSEIQQVKQQLIKSP
jgi:hypothetical protein